MVICLDCLEYELKMKLLKGENVEGYRRIYPAEDWSYYPSCSVCGMVIEYVNLVATPEEVEIAILLAKEDKAKLSSAPSDKKFIYKLWEEDIRFP